MSITSCLILVVFALHQVRSLVEAEVGAAEAYPDEYPNFLGASSSNKETLLEKILGFKDVAMRFPTLSPKQKLHVNVSGTLYQIIAVNQKANLIHIAGYFELHWKNPWLRWDPADFENETSVHIPLRHIWRPEIYQYHSVDNTEILVHESSMALLSFDGRVRAFVQYSPLFFCPIDVKHFPFDTQTCNFKLGSWSMSSQKIEYGISQTEVKTNRFYSNPEWTLDASSLQPCRIHYTDDLGRAEDFSCFSLNIKITRRCFYYIFNLIIPCTVVTMVALFGFHRSAKMRESTFRLGIMTLLSLAVLLLTVVGDLPRFSWASGGKIEQSTSGIPVMALFYLYVLLLIGSSTIIFSWMSWLDSYAKRHPNVPIFLRCLAVCCGKQPQYLSTENEPMTWHEEEEEGRLLNGLEESVELNGSVNTIQNGLLRGSAGEERLFQGLEPKVYTLQAYSVLSRGNSDCKQRKGQSVIVHRPQEIGTQVAAHGLSASLNSAAKALDTFKVRLGHFPEKHYAPPGVSEEWKRVIARIEDLFLCLLLILLFIGLFFFFKWDLWYV